MFIYFNLIQPHYVLSKSSYVIKMLLNCSIKGCRGKEQSRRPVGGLQEGHGGQTEAQARLKLRGTRQSDVHVVGAEEADREILGQIDAAAAVDTAQGPNSIVKKLA